jgi:hypothetical protein
MAKPFFRFSPRAFSLPRGETGRHVSPQFPPDIASIASNFPAVKSLQEKSILAFRLLDGS